MDLKRLHYFYTIAKEGQITKAAKKLHINQPPLSKSLKDLEIELGVTLLDRNHRRLHLTEAGEVLFKKVETLFSHIDDTVLEVKDTGEGYQGKLAIGCVKTCFSNIPERLKQFRINYPDISFKLKEGDSYILAEHLINRDIDLAIVRLPLDLEPFESVHLPDENYVAVLPSDWKNESKGNAISMDELSKHPLMLLHRISGVGQYEVILEKFKRHGLEPNIILECPDVDMILDLVNAGVGGSIIPQSTLSNNKLRNIKTLNINDEEIQSQSAIIWDKNRYLTKSAKRFIEMFQ
ncbi:LysR family transcriptional regulator [Tenuibacillus multivorans]|uniref:DNA-binding transcriptional regulator, LysR family n=1 Tax=Tenuibacillus multivorans TaxID=237069 RepID=A0A1H0ER95_9BACI|nr:LysR family transcriptional regulator [Tenuibacillus multivorans]GEL76990.1 HTH-type transcriptional regulator BsdA [Tenuibacillus multivorans]SDN84856.1 DNA-binding transcriptional regulator, LysR family [Tenuibacillus multivorans]